MEEDELMAAKSRREGRTNMETDLLLVQVKEAIERADTLADWKIATTFNKYHPSEKQNRLLKIDLLIHDGATIRLIDNPGIFRRIKCLFLRLNPKVRVIPFNRLVISLPKKK